mmetsp:Transcript_23298/g.58951  ORF Transcript_23298/g.58951 Transcript_23298/m.58951 type:complete len:141 (+) Transcript_23298:420-842(+)
MFAIIAPESHDASSRSSASLSSKRLERYGASAASSSCSRSVLVMWTSCADRVRITATLSRQASAFIPFFPTSGRGSTSAAAISDSVSESFVVQQESCSSAFSLFFTITKLGDVPRLPQQHLQSARTSAEQGAVLVLPVVA